MKDCLNRLVAEVDGYASVKVDLCTLINKNVFAVLFDMGKYIPYRCVIHFYCQIHLFRIIFG